MDSLKIVLFCIVAACVYGVLHDQITVRISLEYFTIGHPVIFSGVLAPSSLALAWGIIATWWVGLILGTLIALSAQAGNRPKLPFRSVVRPVFTLLCIMAVVALFAGIIGYWLANSGSISLWPRMAARIPSDRHVAFLTVLWIHNASYLAGFLGGAILCTQLYRRRTRVVSNSIKTE